MTRKTFYESSPVDATEIEAAADAMRAVADSEQANERGGVSWYFLAQVALEAAICARGKNPQQAPDGLQ